MQSLPLFLAQMSHAVGEAADGPQLIHFLFNPAVVWVLIPIVAIVVGTIGTIIHKSQQHRERMAMIAAGMHPDFPPDEDLEGNDDRMRETADYRSD